MTMIIFVKLVVAAMTKMAKITTSSHKEGRKLVRKGFFGVGK